MKEMSGVSPAPMGVALTQVRLTKSSNWILLKDFNGTRADLGDLDENIRVIILLTNNEKQPLPKGNLKSNKNAPYIPDIKHQNTDEFAAPIRVVAHEFILHARYAAERVYKFKTDENSSISSLQQAERDATDEIYMYGLAKSTFAKEHQVISGLDNEGNRIPYDADYERVNDTTYNMLKNPQEDIQLPKIVRVAPQKNNPGVDGYNADYVPPGNLDADKDYIETIPPAEAFLVERLTERQTYTSPEQKELTNKTIAKEYEKYKKQ